MGPLISGISGEYSTSHNMGASRDQMSLISSRWTTTRKSKREFSCSAFRNSPYPSMGIHSSDTEYKQWYNYSEISSLPSQNGQRGEKNKWQQMLWMWGMDVRKDEHFLTAVGNSDWYIYHGKQCRGFFKRLKLNWPYDPVVLFLNMCTIVSYSRDNCSYMYIDSLLTIVRKWKQPICLLTDDQLIKMWCICTMEYYFAI